MSPPAGLPGPQPLEPARPECLPADLIAAHVEGRLSGAAALRARRHLESCSECAELAAAVAALPAALPAAGRRTRLPRLFAAAGAAAALLVAIVLLRALAPGQESLQVVASAGGAEVLAGADGTLVVRSPGRVGRTRLSRAIRLRTESGGPLRGPGSALLPLSPRGSTAARRPPFRWSPEDVEVHVALRVGDRVLWETTARGGRLPYPDRAPDLAEGVEGTWRLDAEGLEPASETFRVLEAGAARALERDLEAVASLAEGAFRRLVEGLVLEAHGCAGDAVGAWLEARQDDRLKPAAQAALERVLGEAAPR
jgi:hypothetical protein